MHLLRDPRLVSGVTRKAQRLPRTGTRRETGNGGECREKRRGPDPAANCRRKSSRLMRYDDAARQRVSAAHGQRIAARPRAHARRRCRQVRVERSGHGRRVKSRAWMNELYAEGPPPQSAARAGRRSTEAVCRGDATRLAMRRSMAGRATWPRRGARCRYRDTGTDTDRSGCSCSPAPTAGRGRSRHGKRASPTAHTH